MAAEFTVEVIKQLELVRLGGGRVSFVSGFFRFCGGACHKVPQYQKFPARIEVDIYLTSQCFRSIVTEMLWGVPTTVYDRIYMIFCGASPLSPNPSFYLTLLLDKGTCSLSLSERAKIKDLIPI